MKLVKSLLLGSAAGLTIVGGAQAADLPVKKAVPIEYVRVCTAYGAGFFYIPGTDTCLRISGRARAEYGYIGSDSRRVTGGGDLSGFTGLARFAFDARTQTGYGTLRAFLRMDMASRTGHTKLSSGTNLRGGYAFSGTGQDAFGRIQNFVNVDKAFIQFAGLTAGRASSFYDFYAADYEIIGSSLGSNMPSTNLLAYTQKFGDGWTATISMEDPNYRTNPLFTNAVPAAGAAAGTGALSTVLTTAPTPIILGTDATGNATAVAFIDAVQRSRLPDFVGSLRYDAPWGSAQLSAAVREINTGGFLASVGVPGTGATQSANAQALLAARGISTGAQTDYGWAVQGGVKFNLPFIAPGDGLYLQGAYGEGTSFYTGINRFTAGYLANASVYAGNPFNQYLADAVVNPLTGRLELSSSFTAVASYLHYWSPEWRSAFYASDGRPSGHQPGERSGQQRQHRCSGLLPHQPGRLRHQPVAARYLPDRDRREPDLVAGQGSRYRHRGPVHPDGRQERPRRRPGQGRLHWCRQRPSPDPHGQQRGRVPGPLPRAARLLSRTRGRPRACRFKTPPPGDGRRGRKTSRPRLNGRGFFVPAAERYRSVVRQAAASTRERRGLQSAPMTVSSRRIAGRRGGRAPCPCRRFRRHQRRRTALRPDRAWFASAGLSGCRSFSWSRQRPIPSACRASPRAWNGRHRRSRPRPGRGSPSPGCGSRWRGAT
jgi:hypothetical protein